MRGKTNLPKGIVYKDPDVDETTLHWTPNALPISDNLIKALQFGNKIIVLGDSGNIAVSEDGLYWACSKIGDYKFADMIIVDDTCIIVGGDLTNKTGVITKSQDLVHWETKDDYMFHESEGYSLQTFLAIAHNGETYILLGSAATSSNQRIYGYTSINLSVFSAGTWTGKDKSSTKAIWANNRLLFYTPGDSRVYITTDGINFNSYSHGLQTIGKNQKFDSLFFVNDRFFWIICAWVNSPTRYTYNILSSIGGNQWDTILYINEPSDSDVGKILVNLIGINQGIFLKEKFYLFSDNGVQTINDMDNYTSSDINNFDRVATGVVIKSTIYTKNRIICICEGGIVVTADMEIGDRELTVLPQAVDNTLYIKKTDNVRKLLVKAVTSDIDADIKPENIKAGITILGVTGTYESGV